MDNRNDVILNLIIFTSIVFVAIVYFNMILYGKTNVDLPDKFFLGYSLGDDFSNLPDDTENGIAVQSYGQFAIYTEKNKIVYALTDDSSLWEFYEFKSKKGEIASFHKETFPIYTIKEARGVMSKLSKRLSEKYTEGHGLRRYKRSRNYVFNKNQGIMLEIRLERYRDYYTVNIYYMKYSWFRKFSRNLYWATIARQHPRFDFIDKLFFWL